MHVKSLTVRRGRGAQVGFIRMIVQQVRAAVAYHLWDSYRPEVHYMRGPGPKSRRRATAGGRRAP
jgi:hypothetical protein